MTRKATPQKYEPPQAVYLNDSDRAYGLCNSGSTYLGINVGCYRGDGLPVGVCVTGKSATAGCYAGVG